MTIIRTINREKVRHWCIQNNYYTCGNNSEYSKMLDMCDDYDKQEASDELIINIAQNIWNHSDMDEFIASGGDFECFLFGILNNCIRFEVV